MSEDAVPGINQQLKDIIKKEEIQERFETQRRNIGKAYGLANKIREASKDGVFHLGSKDFENALLCSDEMKSAWQDLISLDLPADIAWQHQAEAGQEMVEFIYVQLLYKGILIGQTPKLPSYQDLMVTPQTWLAGIGDATTELGKLMLKDLLDTKPSIDDRILDYEKFLKIYRELYDFLERLENVYGLVINNSRRRGYGNTYRGLVLRIQRFIERQEEKLLELSNQRELLSQMRQLMNKS
ncbi:MAG: hypothetical protein HYY86_01590 [Candidatus Harrisonbacteria bacterium]|nr:hypothetical protein [Candidatus Harrisonbacteria bacterium]